MNLFSSNINIPISTVVWTVLIIAVTLFLLSQFRGYLFSPGPWGLPIFGFYPFLREDFHVQLAELTSKYGDLYLLSMGGKSLLHIGSHKALREIFLKNADKLSGRSRENVAMSIIFNNGLLLMNDTTWRVWRKFLGQSMREVGINPQELKGPMLDSVQDIIKCLEESKGNNIDLSSVLCLHCTETVRRLVLGENVTSETALKLNRAYIKATLPLAKQDILLSGFFARHLILPLTKGYKEVIQSKKEMNNILRDIIHQHRLHFNSNEPRDLIDLYLKEKEIREQRKDVNAVHFNDDALIGTLIQVYGDGGHSIGGFVACYLKELALRPDIQNIIYKEIVREIGTERMPTYNDREKLPYTNAIAKEIERILTFFPIMPTLETNCDFTVNNVFIPKGTITLVNQHAIHSNPFTYRNPECFDPMRFTPSNDSETPIPELPITFGIGKHACAGEILVRMELFLILVTVMQNFTLQLENIKNDDQKTVDFFEILNSKFRAIPRKKI